MSPCLQYLNLAIQCAILVALVWYTALTYKLQQQGQRQLSLLRHQIQLGLAPYLVAWLTEFLPGGEAFKKSPLAAIRPKFRCSVLNHTDRIAHHIYAAVYEQEKDAYYWSEDGIEAIGRRDENPMILEPERLESRDAVVARIRNQCGPRSEQFLDLLTPKSRRAFLLLFYRDLEDTQYVIEREFEFDTNAHLRHSLSKLHLGKAPDHLPQD